MEPQEKQVQENKQYNWHSAAIFNFTGDEFGFIFNTFQNLQQVNQLLMSKFQGGIVSGIITEQPEVKIPENKEKTKKSEKEKV